MRFEELVHSLVDADVAALKAQRGERAIDRIVSPGRLVPGEQRGPLEPPLDQVAGTIKHGEDRLGDLIHRGGFEVSAASPQTSGSDPARETATGVPDTIASSGGWPKPS